MDTLSNAYLSASMYRTPICDGCGAEIRGEVIVIDGCRLCEGCAAPGVPAMPKRLKPPGDENR